jgi:hypothetical protein
VEGFRSFPHPPPRSLGRLRAVTVLSPSPRARRAHPRTRALTFLQTRCTPLLPHPLRVLLPSHLLCPLRLLHMSSRQRASLLPRRRRRHLLIVVASLRASS